MLLKKTVLIVGILTKQCSYKESFFDFNSSSQVFIYSNREETYLSDNEKELFFEMVNNEFIYNYAGKSNPRTCLYSVSVENNGRIDWYYIDKSSVIKNGNMFSINQKHAFKLHDLIDEFYQHGKIRLNGIKKVEISDSKNTVSITDSDLISLFCRIIDFDNASIAKNVSNKENKSEENKDESDRRNVDINIHAFVIDDNSVLSDSLYYQIIIYYTDSPVVKFISISSLVNGCAYYYQSDYGDIGEYFFEKISNLYYRADRQVGGLL